MPKRRIEHAPRNPALHCPGAKPRDPSVVATVRHRRKILRQSRGGQQGKKAENRCTTGDYGQIMAPDQRALPKPSPRPCPTQAQRPSPANLRPWVIPFHPGPNIPGVRGLAPALLNQVNFLGDATRPIRAYIDRMTIKRAALFAPLALCLGLSAQAAEVPLDKLSTYINSLTSAEARFVQTNADGSTAKGRIILQRPGRARFEYDPPDKNLVLASGQMVAIFDAKSNQPPEQYPLARTPLNLILAPQVNLSAAKMVIDHGEFQGATHVLAQDPKHPDYGTIELIFSEDPVALTEWIITDDIGNQTSVMLEPLKTGGTYPASLFSIDLETGRRAKN